VSTYPSLSSSFIRTAEKEGERRRKTDASLSLPFLPSLPVRPSRSGARLSESKLELRERGKSLNGLSGTISLRPSTNDLDQSLRISLRSTRLPSWDRLTSLEDRLEFLCSTWLLLRFFRDLSLGRRLSVVRRLSGRISRRGSNSL